MHVVGFTIEIYYDAWPFEREICCFVLSAYVNWYSERTKIRSMGDLKNELRIVRDIMFVVFSVVTPCCFVNGYEIL